MRGKVIDKKWFIKIGWLWGLQVGGQQGAALENLVGYSFIIKGKVGRKKRQPSSAFLSRRHASIISSSSRLDRGVFLSLHGQAWTVMALWKNYFRSQYNEGLSLWNATFPYIIVFHVGREHVLGVINLLSSLGRMWVSCHHFFIVWGHVSCFCCMVLLLSTPAWFCGQANLFL